MSKISFFYIVSVAEEFELRFVGNPGDRFSHIEAQVSYSEAVELNDGPFYVYMEIIENLIVSYLSTIL